MYTRYSFVEDPALEVLSWEYGFNIVIFKLINKDQPRFNDATVTVTSKEAFNNLVLPGYKAIYREEV